MRFRKDTTTSIGAPKTSQKAVVVISSDESSSLEIKGENKYCCISITRKYHLIFLFGRTLEIVLKRKR